MIKKTIEWLIIILFTLPGRTVAAECLKYEPATIELTGTIKRATFPGPPNWQSVKEGDKPERYWVLYLLKTICVDGDPNNDINEPEQDVRALQLIVQGGYDRYRKFLNRKVTVTGELTHAITGHHRTSVLLTVRGMKKAERSNLDWLLDCSYGGKDFHYYDSIEKLKAGSVPEKEIAAELNRRLLSLVINENSQCIYAPILYFGDDSTVRFFRKRAGAPKKYDRPGDANDILISLTSRSKQFSSKEAFIEMINLFENPTSIEYFLEMHLRDLPFLSQMEVMTYVTKERKLPGYHNYAAPEIMRKLYKKDPLAYDSYLKTLPDVPGEFTCFKNETCP